MLTLGIFRYWGGQAVKIVLSAVIGPKYAFMKNTLPPSANVDTCSLVSFFIFLVIFCPMLLIPPEKLQMPLKVSSYPRQSLRQVDTDLPTDCVCNDRLQHLWDADLVSTHSSWPWQSISFSSCRIWEYFELECRLWHTSNPGFVVRWYRRPIRYA